MDESESHARDILENNGVTSQPGGEHRFRTKGPRSEGDKCKRLSWCINCFLPWVNAVQQHDTINVAILLHFIQDVQHSHELSLRKWFEMVSNMKSDRLAHLFRWHAAPSDPGWFIGDVEYWRLGHVPLRLRVPKQVAGGFQLDPLLQHLVQVYHVQTGSEMLVLLKWQTGGYFDILLPPFVASVEQSVNKLTEDHVQSYFKSGVLSWRPPFPNPERRLGIATLKQKVQSCTSIIWKLQMCQQQIPYREDEGPHVNEIVKGAYKRPMKKQKKRENNKMDPNMCLSHHGVVGAQMHVQNFERLLVLKEGPAYWDHYVLTREDSANWPRPTFDSKFDLKASTRQKCFYLTGLSTSARNIEVRTIFNGFVAVVQQPKQVRTTPMRSSNYSPLWAALTHNSHLPLSCTTAEIPTSPGQPLCPLSHFYHQDGRFVSTWNVS